MHIRHTCSYGKILTPSWENQAEAFSKRVTRALSSHQKPKAKVLSVEMIERGLC